MLLPQTLLILPGVATRGGAAIAHVLDSKTSQPIRSAYPVGLTWVTLHASGSAAKHRVERALDTGGPTVQHVRVSGSWSRLGARAAPGRFGCRARPRAGALRTSDAVCAASPAWRFPLGALHP